MDFDATALLIYVEQGESAHETELVPAWEQRLPSLSM
jgi:hypothetical protein